MSIDEEWRDVPGYEGVYRVSSRGGLICLLAGSGRHKNRHLPGRRVKGSLRNGYRRVRSVVPADNGKNLNFHVLVARAFHGEPVKGQVVRHLNGVRDDNRAENLSWGTPKENSKDMIRHGTNVNASKTHCPENHPYDQENTYLTPSGTRMCRICTSSREYLRRAETRKRGLPDGDSKHGTESGYKHFGCRCAPCKKAASINYERRKNATSKS